MLRFIPYDCSYIIFLSQEPNTGNQHNERIAIKKDEQNRHQIKPSPLPCCYISLTPQCILPNAALSTEPARR